MLEKQYYALSPACLLICQKIPEEKVGYYREHNQVGEGCNIYEATSDDGVRGYTSLFSR
jgi:hypothetical protein